MMGFTLFAAQTLNVLGNYPKLQAYLQRISARPTFAETLEKLPLQAS